MTKKCPNCDLVNPQSALRCDCGYDFKTGKIDAKAQAPESSTFRDAVLALGTIAALFTLVLIIAGIAYAIEGTGGETEWEGDLMLTSAILFLLGYVVGWFRRLWGGTIILLSGLFLSLPLIVIQLDSAISIFALPILIFGMLYLLLYRIERRSSGVE